MAGKYNLRNKKNKKEKNEKKKVKSDSDDTENEFIDSDSDYTTTSNESSESEIDTSEEESDEECEEDEESEEESDEEESEDERPRSKRKTKEEDPMNLNITFTVSGEETESESESESDSESPKVDLQKYKEVLDKLQELNTTYKDLPITKQLKLLYTKEFKKYEKEKEKEETRLKQKNSKRYSKLSSFKPMSDDKYFSSLSLEQQQQIISSLEVITQINPKPLRIRILESPMPNEYKVHALKKIQAMDQLSELENGEFHKTKQWVDTFMEIPFGQYKDLPVSIHDGVEQSHAFLENAKHILDEATYGLDDAKMQIIQFIGQLITNPKSSGTCIAFEGPMGTGKTTLCKEGISKILNRPFEFFALGGATDSSTLEGHSITYEGSIYGKIVATLMKCKCMNPVFYFDELDKVSKDMKGEEIIGILTHLTDPSQNSKFHDKYYSEIDFDLSRAIFIFSYNNRENVNPILRDRMYVIKTEGYTTPQKLIISKQYLSKAIRQNINFTEEDIHIPDNVIQHMVEKYTNGEKGVRELKRCIETIYSKLNLFRIMKPETNLFMKDMNIQVTFPFTVTLEVVQRLLKQEDTPPNNMMYL
jgi:ATP-dependent Lon protease